MTQQTENLAILFADISGSTALYDKLGDERARAIVARCVALMSGEVAPQGGTVIKTIGDEIMCTFPGAEQAMRAACGMQLAIDAGRPGGSTPIYIHIGFHFGTVIRDDGDVFGDAVNVAARVAGMTRAREIATTQDTVDRLPGELREKVRPILRASFKGKQDEFEVYRVVWELDDTMSTRIGLPLERRPNAGEETVLQLRYQNHAWTLDEQHRSIVLGRGQDCEIIVQNTLASRQHARIEYRFGKFAFADHSSNGSYVRFKDGQVVRLAHEEVILHGSGSISLGLSFDGSQAEIVEFIVQ